MDTIKERKSLREGLDVDRIPGNFNRMIDQQLQQRGSGEASCVKDVCWRPLHSILPPAIWAGAFPPIRRGYWFFNPFAWQVLFMFGAWLALGGANESRSVINSPSFCMQG